MPVVISGSIVVPDTPTRPQKCVKVQAKRQQKIVAKWPRCRGKL